MTDTEIKFIKKYMRVAKQFGEDQNPCYSRSIGACIVDPESNKILGMGYNGPPRKTYHCTHPEYLRKVVYPQLTQLEISNAFKNLDVDNNVDEFVKHYANCKQCPRRIIGADSGTRYEICSCIHAECNAIINASQDLRNSWMFIWGGSPCWECAKMVANARISKIFCTKTGYALTDRVRFLLLWAGIDTYFYSEEELLKET